MITLDSVLIFVGSATIDEIRTIEDALNRRLDQLDDQERRKHLQAIAPAVNQTLERLDNLKRERNLTPIGVIPQAESRQPAPRNMEQVKRQLREHVKLTMGVTI